MAYYVPKVLFWMIVVEVIFRNCCDHFNEVSCPAPELGKFELRLCIRKTLNEKLASFNLAHHF